MHEGYFPKRITIFDFETLKIDNKYRRIDKININMAILAASEKLP